jgi:hypothetical protein
MAPVASKGKVLVLDSSPRTVTATEVSESKAVSKFDPNSKADTAIVGPSGALAGSVITLPAGSLAIATELIVEEAVSLSDTSLVSSLSMDSAVEVKPVGAGLIIRPSENVDLTKPLTIAMPINPTGGLRSWLERKLGLAPVYYTVFYKHFVEGELRAGAIPTSALRITDDGLVYFEGYFGAYWLAEVSVPIENKIEVKTDEPIVNKDNVSVIESTGIVNEAKVSERAQVPLVVWGAVSLTLDESTRTLKAQASIGAERQVSECSLDLFKDATSTSGQSIRTGSQLSWLITPDRSESYSVQARFRCQDDQGRLTISPWSALVTVPALVIPPVTWEEVGLSYATATETATLTARIGAGRSVGSCRAELLEAGKISSQTVTVLTHSWKIADSSSHTVQGRFVCVDDLGRETIAPWSPSVTIPPAPLVQWNNVSLVADTQTRSVNLGAQIGSGRSLVNCVAELSVSTTATPFLSSGVASLSFQYAATQTTAMSLVGRFRCDDDRGRATVSPWSQTVGLPAVTMGPLLNTVSDRILPSQHLVAGNTLSLDFVNNNVSPASDTGMSYQCAFRRLASSDSSLINCSQLSGSFSFDGSNGQLNWSPDLVAVGAYQFEITGSNSFGSANSLFKVNVLPAIDYGNRLFHLDARFADGLRGGQNGSSASTTWKNLINQAPLSMSDFVPTSTWTGSNVGPDLTALAFPGSTAVASFPAPYSTTQSEIHFDALIFEGLNATEKVILSSGSSSGQGFTLTNRRFFVGLNPYGSIGNYTTEVMMDTPQLYWRFNDLANNIIEDSSGNGRVGNVLNSGGVTLTPDALNDSGSQAVLNTGNARYQLPTVYDPGPNWTIETWFKYPLDDNCADDWCSLVRGSNTNYHWVIVQEGTMDIGVHYNAFHSSGFSLSQLNSGWHHLAAVGSGGNTQFYIDGNLVGTVVGIQASGQIGWIAGEGVFSFGEIDEFAIYNQALPVARIQAHAQAGGTPIQCALDLDAHSWNHIVGTISDTTQSLKIHLNGQDICTVTKPASMQFAGSSEPIRLGASAQAGSTGWNGAVTSLILYNDSSPANAAVNSSALNPVNP